MTTVCLCQNLISKRHPNSQILASSSSGSQFLSLAWRALINFLFLNFHLLPGCYRSRWWSSQMMIASSSNQLSVSPARPSLGPLSQLWWRPPSSTLGWAWPQACISSQQCPPYSGAHNLLYSDPIIALLWKSCDLVGSWWHNWPLSTGWTPLAYTARSAQSSAAVVCFAAGLSSWPWLSWDSTWSTWWRIANTCAHFLWLIRYMQVWTWSGSSLSGQRWNARTRTSWDTAYLCRSPRRESPAAGWFHSSTFQEAALAALSGSDSIEAWSKSQEAGSRKLDVVWSFANIADTFALDFQYASCWRPWGLILFDSSTELVFHVALCSSHHRLLDVHLQILYFMSSFLGHLCSNRVLTAWSPAWRKSASHSSCRRCSERLFQICC